MLRKIRQLEPKRYVPAQWFPDNLLLSLLNNEYDVAPQYSRGLEDVVAYTEEVQQRVLALISALRDIALDVAGKLPPDYPQEGPMAAVGERLIIEMDAARAGTVPPPHWPRPNLFSRGPRPGIGQAVCWGNANALLADYLVEIQVGMAALDDDGIEAGWEVRESTVGSRPRVEFRLISAVLELAKRGLLDRLRACACGEWFYAEPATRKFHQRSCRQMAYQHSDKGRTRNREYQRWHYAMYQSPKAPRKKLTRAQWQQQVAEGKIAKYTRAKKPRVSG